MFRRCPSSILLRNSTRLTSTQWNEIASETNNALSELQQQTHHSNNTKFNSNSFMDQTFDGDDDFGFYTTRMMHFSDYSENTTDSSIMEHDYNNSEINLPVSSRSAEIQSPEQVLRIAESSFSSRSGYAYAILPFVDIMHQAFRRGILFDIDHPLRRQGSETQGEEEAIITAIPKEHRKKIRSNRFSYNFVRWFPTDPLALCKCPTVLTRTAGDERSPIIQGMLLEMFHEFESPIPVSPQGNLTSASPLTRAMLEVGMFHDKSIHVPWSKLLRGVAIAMCRSDVCLDLPTLSTSIINDDPILFQAFINQSLQNQKINAENDNGDYLLYSGLSFLPSLSVVLNQNKNINTKKGKDHEGEVEDFITPFSQGGINKMNNNNVAASDSDRASLWIHLLLAAGAEAGSYNCCLHAAELLKLRNMQTTMELQRLMTLTCHNHVRREHDWKFRMTGGLRRSFRKWMAEYFPKVEHDRAMMLKNQKHTKNKKM